MKSVTVTRGFVYGDHAIVFFNDRNSDGAALYGEAASAPDWFREPDRGSYEFRGRKAQRANFRRRENER